MSDPPPALTSAQQRRLYNLQLKAQQQVAVAKRRYNRSIDAIQAEYQKALKREGLPDVAITVTT